MKNKLLLAVALFIDIVAGIWIGSRLLINSRLIYHLPLALGILCILAVIYAIITYVLYCKGKKGKFYIVVIVLTVILNIPVVFYTMIFILEMFGFYFLPPPQQ